MPAGVACNGKEAEPLVCCNRGAGLRFGGTFPGRVAGASEHFLRGLLRGTDEEGAEEKEGRGERERVKTLLLSGEGEGGRTSVGSLSGMLRATSIISCAFVMERWVPCGGVRV